MSLRGLDDRRGTDYEVDAKTGCWNWLKGLSEAGYPHGYAQRRYWETVNGPRPEGFDMHHLCKNPACVNPAHLQAIDRREHDKIHFLHERMGITEQDVRDIRELGRRHVNVWDVCAMYGISNFTVYAYWNGKRWPDLIDSGPVERTPPTCAHPDCDKPASNKRDAQYCSEDCQRKAWKRRKIESMRAIKNCLECGADLTHRTRNAKFCTDECSGKNYRERTRHAA